MSVKSVRDLSDEILLGWFDNSHKLFKKMNLKLSSAYPLTMKEEIKKTLPSLDASKFERWFRDLQDTIDVEFSKKGKHQEDVIKFLQGKVRRTLKTNLAESQKVFERSIRYERAQQRMYSWANLNTLRKITVKGSDNDQEKLVGISYAYAGLITGIYRFSLQDCYAWQRLASIEKIDSDKLSNMEVLDIHNYFKTQNLSLVCFDGLDITVRNAVGHSNFKFDKDKQKMIYIDEKSGKISEYTFIEMVENYQKLETVYLAILCMNQLMAVSTCLTVLIKRYQ